MRHRMKKLFSAALAFTLLLSTAASAFAAETEATIPAGYDDVIVLKDGSAQVLKENEIVALEAPVFTQSVTKKNGVDANAADSAHPDFFATHNEKVTVFYVPLNFFEEVYEAEVTYYNKGYQAVIDFPEGMAVDTVAVGTPDPDASGVYTNKNVSGGSDAGMVIVNNSTIVRMTDNALYDNGTIYVPVESFAQDVLGLCAETSGKMAAVSDHLMTDLAKDSEALAALFTDATEDMTAPEPDLVTENVPVLPATITSAGTYMTSRGDVEDLFGDGKDHEWNVYIPASYDKDSEEKVPLLILLHGNSSRCQKYAPRSFYRYLAELHNIILVFPTSTDAGISEDGTAKGQPWNEVFRKADDDNQDVIFLNAMLDYMLDNYNVDESKLFVGGFSNGDLMANRFAASKYGNRLAGCYSAGGAVHYSSAWTSNPLIDGEEGAPVHNVPMYQTRGANDLSALTVNEFGDRNPHIIDPVAEGQKMASSNEYAKQMWLKKNETSQIPEIRVDGINNYEIYRSGDGKGDVLYHSIINEPHAEVINSTQNVWDNLISRYTRNADGTLTDAGVAMKGDEDAVALLVGASKAFIDNTVTELAQEVIRENGLIYAPVDALVKGFGAHVTESAITVNGKTVTITADSADITVDGKTVTLAGKVLEKNDTLYIPAASFAELVLGLHTTEKIDALYICDHNAILSYSTYYTLYRLLDPEDFASFTAMSNMMGIPTTAVAGQEIDLAANAVIYPLNATKNLSDVEWSVYDAGTTGAVIDDTKLTTTAAGTVRVTAMVESGTGTGSEDISSRFLQNFDIVITEPEPTPTPDDDDDDYTPSKPSTPSTPTTPVTPVEKATFTDVPKSHWAYEAVEYLAKAGLVTGTGDGTTFSPEESTTRAMMVTILYRMAGSPAVSGSSAFTDVADGQWYTNAIIWATQQGIVKGYDDGTFGVNDLVTREQMAAFLFRFAKAVAAGSLSGFADADSVSAWAKDAMSWTAEQSFITGKPGSLLDPQGNASRAELVTVLYRYLTK